MSSTSRTVPPPTTSRPKPPPSHARTSQDALDGAALRRLREALGSDGYLRVVFPSADGGAYITGHAPDAPGPDYLVVKAVGATIAEAADKCRVALGEQ